MRGPAAVEPAGLADVRLGRREAVVGRTLLWYPALDSTQDELRRQASAGAKTGTVILAETQSAGRGRRGRQWLDRPGQDLLLSALLEAPGLPPGLLPVALGAGLAQALSAATGAEIQAQWPNDLVVEGDKVAGLLVELVSGRYLAGLGVNVLGARAEVAERTGRAAATLESAAGRSLDRMGVLAACLEALEAVTCRWSPETAAEAIADRDYLRGKPVAIREARGVLRGTAAGVSPAGALCLRTEAGRVEVVVAEAVTVEAEPQS